jgi:predicted 3-demethylubiquinone-9 3-methyltransferase (glyoxalase superfamily)
MSSSLKIVPCLWFDTEAEQAANAYAAIFANSRVTKVTNYPEAGTEIHGRAAGSVMTVSVELDGQNAAGA